MDLKTYFLDLPIDERAAFARRCGTALGHMRNLAYGTRACTEGTAIAIERESAGKVTCEELCPDADWAYLRGTKRKGRAA